MARTAHRLPRLWLSADAIKLIAILCMTLDHIAWGFVKTTSPAGQIMHFFGRLTAPTMCFFIAEGYHHTRSLKKYLLRMGVFAVISHFAFTYFEYGTFLKIGTESMIANLLICLLCVHIVNSERIPKPFCLPLIALLCLAAEYCDWGMRAVLFTLTFELARPYGRRAQCAAYAVAAAVYTLQKWIGNPGQIPQMLYVTGVFLPIPLLCCYSGERGRGGKTARGFMKWFFYMFYPAHLLLLGLLQELLH